MFSQKWEKYENLFLGISFEACPPSQPLITGSPSVRDPLPLRGRVRWGGLCILGPQGCHRMGRALTGVCHTTDTPAATSKPHSPLSSLSSSLPPTLFFFIPQSFLSFNNFITVAEKALHLPPFLPHFLPLPFPHSLSLSIFVTILKIMHRNRKRKQGAENGSWKWPACEPQ